MKRLPSLLLLLLFPITGLADEKLTEHPTIKEMHKVNTELRKGQKLPAQKISEELTKAAQDQAWYMARCHDRGEEDFNHRGGNGTPGKRASKFFYEGLVKENIARGYNSIDDTFKAWLASDTHKDAIFSDTDDAGFGYAIAKDGTTYWVGVYGKPRPTWDLIGSPSRSSGK